MSDWNRRLQEIGLVLSIFSIAMILWFVFWLRDSRTGRGECIEITPDGEQVTHRGKQCKSSEFY
jgi:hypothetical protein